MKKVLKNIFADKFSILIIAIILTLTILPETYSRYIKTDVGETFVQLAKWSVEMIGDTNNELHLLAHSESEAKYNFTITSTSEVACTYSIILSDIPENVSLYIDSSTTPSTRNGSGQIVINNLGEFSENDTNSTHTHLLTFKTNNDTLTTDIEMNLKVNIKQKISGGDN